MSIYRLISIIVTISVLAQDIAWASPGVSTLHPRSALPDHGFIREFVDAYIGKELTDEDRRRIREFMARIADPAVRKMVGEIFGLDTASIEIPKDSKIVRRGEKRLYISPRAMEKMKEMDKFVADREFAAEIAGYGLTKKVDENTSVVIDFIVPRLDRVFVVEGILTEQRISNLMRTLANSRRLTLGLKNGKIALISNNKEYLMTIDDFGWEIVRRYIEKLLPQDCPIKGLPKTPKELKTLLRNKKEISLDTDWDLVVAGSNAWVTDNYMVNVHIEAMKQSASPDFTIHHHPNLGLAIAMLGDKSIEERQGYYKALLRFSPGDLQYMKLHEVEWFEIRAIGTPEDLASQTETTGEFYNMGEIDKMTGPVREVVNELIDISPEDAGPEKLSDLIQRLLPLLEGIKEADFNADTIFRYIIGEDEYNQLKEKTRLPKDINSIKYFVLHFIFREDPLKSFKGIRLEVLKAHVQNGTFEIFKQIMKACRSKSRLKKMVHDFLSENKLWEITLETDPLKIKQGTDLIKEFISTMKNLGQGKKPTSGSPHGGILGAYLFMFVSFLAAACGGGDVISPYAGSDAGAGRDADVSAIEEPDSGRPDADIMQDSGPEDTRPAIEVHPGESIQTAIDMAGEGYVVRVYPGEYTVLRLALKPGVCLVGAGGFGETAIIGEDGEYATAVFGADNATLEGFTIYVPQFSYRPEDLQYTRAIVEAWRGSSGTVIRNSIIGAWTPELERIWVAEGSSLDISYSLVDLQEQIHGPVTIGEGVIYGDPLFVDPDNNDYSLQGDSPAINTGDPESPSDPDGTRADMGAVPYDHRMGRITPKDSDVRYAGIAVPVVAAGYTRSVSRRRRYINRFLAAIVLALTLFGSRVASADNPPPSRPPVTLKELVRTRQLDPKAKLRVAWDILADTEPDVYSRYSNVPVELDPRMTDGAASTNAGEMNVPPSIKVSTPWMEGRLDRKEPKTALYVAMVLRHEIQHIIDAGGVTNIFKWWWAMHKLMFGGEERAFGKEQDLLDRYDKKYNLGIDKSLYQRYDILIDSKYHLGYFWTKISILLIDIFILGIIFWGIWRAFLRKKFGKKADELKEKLVDLIDRLMGGDDDNPISSEGAWKGHVEYHRQGRFKEVIQEIAGEFGLIADKGERYDLKKAIQSERNRISTSHGELRIEPDGILVIIDSRFKKDHAGRRQMSVYARNEQKARHELAELRAWIDYAKKELGMTDKGIRNGSLNRWMQDKRNIKKVRELHREFHRKGIEAERALNIPFAEANARIEEGILKIDGGEDIERLQGVISNLKQSVSSRKDIRSILSFISPFKIRFVINAFSTVRIYKESDGYILELDISNFADWGRFGVPKKLLMAELRMVTANMILDSIETDIPRDILLDIILILLDSQDINRRYRSGNRKVIAKRSRREYLDRLRHDKGRQYVTLLKRLSHTSDLEEKVRLIYLYLEGKEEDGELLRLQNFFTQNRGTLIRIRLAYNRLERKVRIEPAPEESVPVIARHEVPKQSGTHKRDFGGPESLLDMPLYVFIILWISILSLLSFLSLGPIRAKAEEKPLPPIVSPPVREEPRPKQESFGHTVIPRIPDDCLWHIARKYYGVSSRRIERYIADYNNKNNPDYKIKDIDIIIDGRKIILPYRIVHRVRGKNVHVRQVARMYNVSEGYLRVMNPRIPLDGRLRRGDEIEIAVRIETTPSDNIGKDVEFIVNTDGTITITKEGKRLAENLSVTPVDIDTARISGLAKGLNVHSEFGDSFISAFDSVRIMVFTGTSHSRSAGAFAHMGEDGVLYIDSVLLNNDMAIIHEVIHAYLRRIPLEELVAMIDRTKFKDKIVKKAGDNPALLRHYYARYYLQDPVEGVYKGSANEGLTNEIRKEMARLLDNLGDSAGSFRLREAFIKLIKEDGEITKDELEILVKHIENVMNAIDLLTVSLDDEEKREAIIRIALYLSIEEIQRIKELEKMPRGDIRRYFYQRTEVARRLGVGPQEIESISPSSTDVAVVINKYFRDRKERQEVAGQVVDVVTRYLLDQLEVDKKTKDSIERIIRSKNIEILTPLPIVVEVSGNVILQDLSIYSKENMDSMAIGVIRDLAKGNQQVMVYTEETQKEGFIKLLEEKGVAELQDKLAFIDISRCNSYEDIKKEVSEKLGLSAPRLISVVKAVEKRFETKDPNDRIVVAGNEGIMDLYLMWKVTLLLMQSGGDIRNSLKEFLKEYYKGTEYEGEVSDLVEEMFRHGIYIVLPPVVPFMKDYYYTQDAIDRSA